MKRIKVGVYLPQEQVKLLRLASAIRNETHSDLVQRALAYYLRRLRIEGPVTATIRT